MRLSGEKNLIPLNRRTKEEQKEITTAGGKASGESRRRKRSLKEAADLFLSLPVTDAKTFNAMAKAGVNPEDTDYQMAVIVGLTMKAIKGDAKAAKTVIDLLGESATDSQPQQEIKDHSALIEAIKNLK